MHDSSEDWKGAHKKLVLECSKHGIYEICTYNNPTKSRRCKQCGIGKQVKVQSITTDDFVDRNIGTHGQKYDYSTVDYITAHKKVKLTCNECKSKFKISPSKHLSG